MTFRPQLEALEDRLAPAVLTVNSLADNTSDTSVLNLREAITLVNSGGNPSSLGQKTMPAGWASQISGAFGSNDTIQFDPNLFGPVTETITLSGKQLPQITRSLTISGPGYLSSNEWKLAISGNQQSRVFSIAKGVDVAISGLAITNGLVSGSGASGGGIYNAGGTLTLANDGVDNNQAAGTPGKNALGGGIYNAATGVLILRDTQMQGDTAKGGNGVNGINGANGHGPGAAGGNGTAGSNGGQGLGGAIYNAGGEVSIVGDSTAYSSVSGIATGGNGGNGGNGGFGGYVTAAISATGNGGPGGRGGNGGSGGAAFGGGIYNNGGKLSVSNSYLFGSASAGSGGAGGAGGNGGNGAINTRNMYHANAGAGAAGGNAGAGAQALGGAIYNPTGSVLITSDSNVGGNINGGYGGGGGNGGSGGGVFGEAPSSVSYIGNGGNGSKGGLSAVGGAGLGGGIYNGSGSITILNSTLSMGQADAGIGGNGGAGGDGTRVSTQGNGGSGQNGSASGLAAGGALYSAAGPVMLENDSITNNNAWNNGGGLGGGAGVGGYAGMAGNGGVGLPASGGAIFSAGGSVSVNQSTVASNSAETSSGAGAGAGAVGTNGTDSFDGNGGAAGTAEGGAIDISGGTFALTNSFLGGNSAVGGPGGNENYTGGYGGGTGGSGGNALGGAIQVSGGTLTITNSTFSNWPVAGGSNNYATGGTGGRGGVGDNGGNGGQGGSGGTALGGNINVTAGTVILNSDTIADGQTTGGSGGSGGNVSPSQGGSPGAAGGAGSGLGGGIQVNSGAVVKVFNTIIALSTASSAPTSTDVAGAFTSQGHNLIGDGSDSTGFSAALGDQVGTSASPINPMLAAPVTYPGTNGGPTDTMALLPGSPAINAGGLPKSPTVPATDQRGMSRDSHPDIGAFEYNATYDNNSGNSFPTLFAPTPQSPLSYAPTVYAKVGATFDLGSIIDDILSTPWKETVTVNWGDKTLATTSSVSWNGGTGLQTVSLGTQSHTYAAPGVYTVTESVKNSGGIVSTEYYLVNVGSLSAKPSASTQTAGTSDGLTLSMVDAFGHPMAGYRGTVTLSSTGSATFLDAATGKTLTNNQYTFTANDEGTHAFKVIETKAGTQTIRVTDSSSGGPVGSTTITVKPAAPANLTVTSGSGQTATVNTAFALPLEVTVTDAYGNVISGVAVTFTAPTGGASGTFTGSVSSVAVNTNAQGVAVAPTFTANGTAGNYSVTASVMGLTAKSYLQLTNQLAS